jgi:hypothetical protein
MNISWFFRLFYSFFWINKNALITKNESKREIIILLPSLDEAPILRDTVKYFNSIIGRKNNVRLIIITTEKEYGLLEEKYSDFQNDITFNQVIDKNGVVRKKNTIQIALELEKEFPEVELLHYPNSEGKMAHQLNFAMKKILSEEKSYYKPLFVVYNADSRPQEDTFTWLNSIEDSGDKSVLQQYGNYLKNLESIQGQPMEDVLVAAAIWQTRWSVGFEIFNALKQYKFINNKESLRFPFNYCIGHGIFYTEDIYNKLEGFNEEMHNEDAIFGLQLSYYRDFINPLPFFDCADSVDSIRGLYNQQASWYFGPMQAFFYYKYLISRIDKINRTRLFVLALKLFFHSIYWIMGPTLLFLAIFLAIIQGKLFLVLIIFSVGFSFLVFPGFATWIMMKKMKGTPKVSDLKILKHLIFGSIPFYFIHGFAAYIALGRYLKSRITKKQILKKKTIMKRNQH